MTASVTTHAPAGLSAEVLRSTGAIAAVAEEWSVFLRELAGRHAIFQHPAFVLAELENRSDYEPAVVTVRHDGRLAAILPGFVQTMRVGVSLSVLGAVGRRTRVVRVFGSDAVFARDADAPACLSAALEALEASQAGTRLVMLEELETGGALSAALEAAGGRLGRFRLRRTSSRPESIHRVIMPPDHESYVRAMAGHARNLLKRRRKKIDAHFAGDVRARRFTREEDVPAMLDLIDEVFARSWQAGTFGARSRRTDTSLRHYRQLARAGWLRSYVLMGGGRPVAFVIGLQDDDSFHYMETAYDQRLSPLAPGLVLLSLVMADLFADHPPRVFDFGFGDNQNKRMFANHQTEAVAACLVSGWPWRAVLWANRAVNGVEAAVRAGLARLGADAAVRRLLKRTPVPAAS